LTGVQLSHESIMRIRSLLFNMEKTCPLIVKTTALKGDDKRYITRLSEEMVVACRQIAKALDPIHTEFK